MVVVVSVVGPLLATSLVVTVIFMLAFPFTVFSMFTMIRLGLTLAREGGSEARTAF